MKCRQFDRRPIVKHRPTCCGAVNKSRKLPCMSENIGIFRPVSDDFGVSFPIHGSKPISRIALFSVVGKSLSRRIRTPERRETFKHKKFALKRISCFPHSNK